MPSRTRPVHTRAPYTTATPPRNTHGRCHGLGVTLITTVAVLAAAAAIILGGLLAGRIPGWYWPIIGLSILLVGTCLLARMGGEQ